MPRYPPALPGGFGSIKASSGISAADTAVNVLRLKLATENKATRNLEYFFCN